MSKTSAAVMGTLLLSACGQGSAADSGNDTVVNLADAAPTTGIRLGRYQTVTGGDQLELLPNDNAILTPTDRPPIPIKWSTLDEHRGMLDFSYAGKGMFCINGNIMRASFGTPTIETLTLNGGPPSAPPNPYPCP